jgi:hypothetical protein
LAAKFIRPVSPPDSSVRCSPSACLGIKSVLVLSLSGFVSAAHIALSARRKKGVLCRRVFTAVV